ATDSPGLSGLVLRLASARISLLSFRCWLTRESVTSSAVNSRTGTLVVLPVAGLRDLSPVVPAVPGVRVVAGVPLGALAPPRADAALERDLGHLDGGVDRRRRQRRDLVVHGQRDDGRRLDVGFVV